MQKNNQMPKKHKKNIEEATTEKNINQAINDKLLSFNPSATKTEIVKKISIPIGGIFSSQKITGSDDELKEKIRNSASNRNLRERISYKISIMMLCELVFTGFLLFGIFIVPFCNALTPTITIDIPPIIHSLSVILFGILTWVILNKYDSLISDCLKILLVLFCLLSINMVPKTHWSVSNSPIILSKDIIQLILLITETIFVKTTVLAGFIITGLFKAAKEQNL